MRWLCDIVCSGISDLFHGRKEQIGELYHYNNAAYTVPTHRKLFTILRCIKSELCNRKHSLINWRGLGVRVRSHRMLRFTKFLFSAAVASFILAFEWLLISGVLRKNKEIAPSLRQSLFSCSGIIVVVCSLLYSCPHHASVSFWILLCVLLLSHCSVQTHSKVHRRRRRYSLHNYTYTTHKPTSIRVVLYFIST